MKLGLGTVQFGLDYGISNRDGQTSAEEASRVLGVASRHGVRVLDTAADYGEAELVLGKILPSDHPFRIVTKTSKLKGVSPGELRSAFKRSLTSLGQKSTYGLLVHHADDLLSPNGAMIMSELHDLKAEGLARKVGVSVYTGEQIDRILERFEIDLVQVPLNLFDQRLIHSGHLKALKQLDIEIHARSVFLQGLLLMEPKSLPGHFAPVRKRLAEYHGAREKLGLSAVSAALGFVLSRPEVDVVLCGANTAAQFEKLCREAERPASAETLSGFAVADAAILNPSLWRK